MAATKLRANVAACSLQGLSAWLVLGVCIFLLADRADAQLRIVNYNTLDNPTTTSDDAWFSTIFDAIGTSDVNGIAKRVDILSLQEQTYYGTSNSTAHRLAGLLNTLYGVTSYQAAVQGTYGTDKLAVVYDSSTVELTSSTAVYLGPTRPGLRAQFHPVGYSSADADFYLYDVHLKAGSEISDILQRQAEVGNLRSNAASLGAGKNVIYTGDFNFSQSNEPGHIDLVAVGDAQPNDPIATPSWPSSTKAWILTQSTHTTSSGGFVGGGIDDRFDLHYATDPLMYGEGVSYIGPTVPGMSTLDPSYRTFANPDIPGNVSDLYNKAINDPLNTSQPVAVLNALYNFSDHLPVVVDYQVPAVMDAALSSVPATLNVGESFDVDVTVSNLADVVAAVGADELDYTLNVSGDLIGSASGTVAALSGGEVQHVTLDTSTPGPKSGTVTLTSTSQAVENPTIILPLITFEVLGGLPGDYNSDGIVDAADYTVWRDGLGTTYTEADFDVWRAHFGESSGSGSLGGATVPEPAAIGSALLAILLCGLRLVRCRVTC